MTAVTTELATNHNDGTRRAVIDVRGLVKTYAGGVEAVKGIPGNKIKASTG